MTNKRRRIEMDVEEDSGAGAASASARTRPTSAASSGHGAGVIDESDGSKAQTESSKQQPPQLQQRRSHRDDYYEAIISSSSDAGAGATAAGADSTAVKSDRIATLPPTEMKAAEADEAAASNHQHQQQQHVSTGSNPTAAGQGAIPTRLPSMSSLTDAVDRRDRERDRDRERVREREMSGMTNISIETSASSMQRRNEAAAAAATGENRVVGNKSVTAGSATGAPASSSAPGSTVVPSGERFDEEAHRRLSAGGGEAAVRPSSAASAGGPRGSFSGSGWPASATAGGNGNGGMLSSPASSSASGTLSSIARRRGEAAQAKASRLSIHTGREPLVGRGVHPIATGGGLSIALGGQGGASEAERERQGARDYQQHAQHDHRQGSEDSATFSAASAMLGFARSAPPQKTHFGEEGVEGQYRHGFQPASQHAHHQEQQQHSSYRNEPQQQSMRSLPMPAYARGAIGQRPTSLDEADERGRERGEEREMEKYSSPGSREGTMRQLPGAMDRGPSKGIYTNVLPPHAHQSGYHGKQQQQALHRSPSTPHQALTPRGAVRTVNVPPASTMAAVVSAAAASAPPGDIGLLPALPHSARSIGGGSSNSGNSGGNAAPTAANTGGRYVGPVFVEGSRVPITPKTAGPMSHSQSYPPPPHSAGLMPPGSARAATFSHAGRSNHSQQQNRNMGNGGRVVPGNGGLAPQAPPGSARSAGFPPQQLLPLQPPPSGSGAATGNSNSNHSGGGPVAPRSPSLSKQQFMSLFETLFDSLTDSRTLQATLEDQVQRSNTLLHTLHSSTLYLEELMDKRLREERFYWEDKVEVLEKRLIELESRASREQHQAPESEPPRPSVLYSPQASRAAPLPSPRGNFPPRAPHDSLHPPPISMTPRSRSSPGSMADSAAHSQRQSLSHPSMSLDGNGKARSPTRPSLPLPRGSPSFPPPGHSSNSLTAAAPDSRPHSLPPPAAAGSSGAYPPLPLSPYAAAYPDSTRSLAVPNSASLRREND